MTKEYKRKELKIKDVIVEDIPGMTSPKLTDQNSIVITPAPDAYTINTDSLLRTLDHTTVGGVDSSVKTVARVLEALINDLKNNGTLQ